MYDARERHQGDGCMSLYNFGKRYETSVEEAFAGLERLATYEAWKERRNEINRAFDDVGGI